MIKKILILVAVFLVSFSLFKVKSICSKKKFLNIKENIVTVSVAKDISILSTIYLKKQNEENLTKNKYNFLLREELSEVLTDIANKKADIAFLPTNIASILYSKMDHKISIIAINTLENFYIVNKNYNIATPEQLKSTDIYIPKEIDYIKPALNFILDKHNLKFNTDYNIKPLDNFKSLILNDFSSKNIDTMVLNELSFKELFGNDSKSQFKEILNLNKEWENHSSNCTLPIGAIVSAKDFIKNSKDELKDFFYDYGENINYINKHLSESANLLKNILNIDENIIKSAIPKCNLVNITGKKMKEIVSTYLDSLKTLDSKLTVEETPGEDFYFCC